MVGKPDPAVCFDSNPGIGGRFPLGGSWLDPGDRHAGIQPGALYRHRANPGDAGRAYPDPDPDPGDPVPDLLGERTGLRWVITAIYPEKEGCAIFEYFCQAFTGKSV